MEEIFSKIWLAQIYFAWYTSCLKRFCAHLISTFIWMSNEPVFFNLGMFGVSIQVD